jgi:hypothetical protein
MKKSQQLSNTSCNPKNHDRKAQLVRDNNITTNGIYILGPCKFFSRMIKDQKNSIKNQNQQKKRITAKQKKIQLQINEAQTHEHTARQQEAAGKHTHCQWTPPSPTNQRPQKKF